MPDGFENPDESEQPSLPLPPDDRLWRHPSEVGRAAPVAQPTAARRVLTTLATGMGVGLVVIGAAVLVGWMDSAPPPVRASAEPIVTHLMSVSTSTTTTTDDSDGPRFLGVYAADIATGVQVTKCQQGSPAAAKLQAGDVILAFDGTRVTRLAQLVAILRHSKPGSLAQIDIDRQGTNQSVWVTLAPGH